MTCIIVHSPQHLASQSNWNTFFLLTGCLDTRYNTPSQVVSLPQCLIPEDGLDMCAPCFGVDHLREVLSDHACSNCSVLPQAVQLARLSSVEQPADWVVSVQQDPLPPGKAAASTKQSAADVLLAPGRRANRRGPPGLSTRVDQLSTELAQMKALLQSLRADGLSGVGLLDLRFGLRCLREVQGNRCLRLLERLWAICSWMFPQPSLLSAFFRRRDAEAAFVVPPLVEYVQELHGRSLGPVDSGLVGHIPAGLRLMTRELGRTLTTLVHARRQVWLAQSSLTEPCRRTLRALRVVPGELFGSAALEALERTAQASRTRQHLAGLHKPARRPVAAGAAGGSLRGSFPPPVPFLGSTSMAPRPRPARSQGDNGGAQALRPVRAAQSGRRFPRPSGGQGARR
ncbi:hypothetical protein GOODEAATRI_016321 [Goodea atripinnis]|uniref:Uncharacterized protein n=1 Tax=Goodea atripinnis TaxID=208336 RepID=A0ABV0PYI1_9TELE